MSTDSQIVQNCMKEVHDALIMPHVVSGEIRTLQAARERIWTSFRCQSEELLMAVVKQIEGTLSMELFKDWATQLIIKHLVAVHPVYSSMPEFEAVEIRSPPVVENKCALPQKSKKAKKNKKAKKTTVVEAVAVESKSSVVPAEEITPAIKEITPAIKEATPAIKEATQVLSATEFPTLKQAKEIDQTKSDVKKSWADETEQDANTIADRNRLMEKLNWSGRLKAASMTLAEIEVMIATEEKTAKSIAASMWAPQAQAKEFVPTKDSSPAPIPAETDWQQVRKTKEVLTSSISEEYCKAHLKARNQKENRAGTVTSSGWWFAKMAGKVPVLPPSQDWYARKLDANDNPIGWYVLKSDANGIPISWKIRRDSQFIHEMKTDENGKRYLEHSEIYDDTDKDGFVTTKIAHVSVECMLWTMCPYQLRHKLGPCPGVTFVRE